MLEIKTIPCNMLGENCYIVSDETKECVIVDCGAASESEKKYIAEYINSNGLKPVQYILTHGHFDHIIGSKFIKDTYDLSPTICERDAEIYKDVKSDAATFGFQIEDDMPALGRCVEDGDTIEFGTHTFKVIHTPGHSRGSVVYYCQKENVAFSGDTLFRNSIGRTDLPGGSMFQIIQSLRKLMQLPDTTEVYPGHGLPTTIGYELSSNPYLDR